MYAVPSPSVRRFLFLPREAGLLILFFLRSSAIVAETCGPFTCIPAILNEYRTPELNVRNGCLKAMSFLFEYIGEMGKDYIHSVVTCLEDALTDRDLVHRQTAATIVKHLALGTAGLGNEDAHLHLMNLIWPNVFESASYLFFFLPAFCYRPGTHLLLSLPAASPHVIGAVLDAIEAMRVALGPGIVLNHVLQGLWHPARRVREVRLFPHFSASFRQSRMR